MSKWQIVEKDDFGTDWHPVRYEDRAIARFDNEADAIVEARRYLTSNNCENALTADEKLASIEMFMMDEQGVYLGELDKKSWYLTYPKDIKAKDQDGKDFIKYAKGDVVQDRQSDHRLEGKTEVKVRTIPGT